MQKCLQNIPFHLVLSLHHSGDYASATKLHRVSVTSDRLNIAAVNASIRDIIFFFPKLFTSLSHSIDGQSYTDSCTGTCRHVGDR